MARKYKSADVVLIKLPNGFTGMIASHMYCDKGPPSKNFFSLAPEIRNKIYELLLVKPEPVDFRERRGFCRSSHLLRINRQFYKKAIPILYGRNFFVFGRCYEKGGPYWSRQWNEIGYGNVRKFLRDIGPGNIPLLRSVSLNFHDALRSDAPYRNLEQRRFSGDQDLLMILKQLARHGRLNDVTLGFAGRQMYKTNTSNKKFTQALHAVQTDILEFGSPQYHALYKSQNFVKRGSWNNISLAAKQYFESRMKRPKRDAPLTL